MDISSDWQSPKPDCIDAETLSIKREEIAPRVPVPGVLTG
jgi:hypothetical protein